jgi:DNA-binding MarR family transcriptional regulator
MQPNARLAAAQLEAAATPAPPPVGSKRVPTGEAPVQDLLSALVDLKSWLRQMHQLEPRDDAGASLFVLAVLERCSPARVGAVAKACHLHMSVVSRQAAALEQAGLLERRQDPTDARAHDLALTPAGRQRLEQRRAVIAALVQDRLCDWRPDELARLAAQLRRLVDDLTVPDAARPPIDDQTDPRDRTSS